MRVVYEYSHFGAAELLQVRYPDCQRDIHEVIAAVKAQRTPDSDEKTMRLCSPAEMTNAFHAALVARDYRELRDSYVITMPNGSQLVASTFKQPCLAKSGVLVAAQFRDSAYLFEDLARFQYFYNEDRADVGVEIVPCRRLQDEMSPGVPHGNELVEVDFERLKRRLPAVPVKLVLVDID